GTAQTRSNRPPPTSLHMSAPVGVPVTLRRWSSRASPTSAQMMGIDTSLSRCSRRCRLPPAPTAARPTVPPYGGALDGLRRDSARAVEVREALPAHSLVDRLWVTAQRRGGIAPCSASTR